jgi:hypothetical protein
MKYVNSSLETIQESKQSRQIQSTLHFHILFYLWEGKTKPLS